LLHHPRALSRLIAELDSGGSEYLDAAIMETLRVRPVVALVDRHVRGHQGRIRREAVTFVPHDGARCVVTTRNQPAAHPAPRPAR
jgi:hypothetical protein